MEVVSSNPGTIFCSFFFNFIYVCICFHILNMFTHFYSEQLQFHGQLTMCYNLGAYISFHILNVFTHFYSEQLQFHGQLTICYNLGAYISFHILNVFTHLYSEQLQFHGQLTICNNIGAYISLHIKQTATRQPQAYRTSIRDAIVMLNDVTMSYLSVFRNFWKSFSCFPI